MFIWRILLLGAFTRDVMSANILFITVVGSPSHHIWNEVIAGGLVAKGHNITMLGHNDPKIKSKNYTLLKITGLEDVYEDVNVHDLIYSKQTAYEDMVTLWKYMMSFAKNDLKSGALKTLLDYPRDMFDLIVIDIVGGQYLYPLVDYFGNPPLVGLSPFGLQPYILDTMNSHLYSYIPIYVLPYTDKMTFLQRVQNKILCMVECYLKQQALDEMFEMSKKRFGENIVPFDKVEKHISLLLANYDPILDFPQPLPPNIIPVGGVHIQRPTKLPDDIKQILDKSKQGAILFSLGTNVEPSVLPMESKKIFLDTFSKLKETVLWKYGGDDLTDIPKNVIIRKWYSQSNIMGHENTKLFITHCGALSTQEAMYYGIPVLGIPLFMDQKNNAGKIEAKMLGKKLEMSTLNADAFHRSILEVMNNPIYKENMQKISQAYRDHKETALERAVFWIERLLKRKDLSHLSIRAREMNLFQRENLDIFVFLSVCVIIFVLLLYVLLKIIYKLFTNGKINKVKLN